jgi:hypothetical protein
MSGVRLRHRSLHSSVALVPLMFKPFEGQSLDTCPTCQVVHPVKMVHLWLDDSGACIVSQGVLADLRKAGLPELDVVEEVKAPPPLTLGIARERLDQDARQVVIYQIGGNGNG